MLTNSLARKQNVELTELTQEDGATQVQIMQFLLENTWVNNCSVTLIVS